MAQQDDPFATPVIQSRIASAISRVQSKWIDWIADSTDGDMDTKIVETLVETLDAHAEIYLTAVDTQELLQEYGELLRRTGEALLKNAEVRGPFSNPYTDDRLRKMAESSAAYRKARTVAEQQRQLHDEIERIRVATQEKALRWADWQNQVIVRVATHFEARYRHWAAEALDQVNRLATAQGDKRSRISPTLGATKWEEIQIWFVSDERLRIHCASEIVNCNYDEFGFADRRDGKPNQAWILLRGLAELHGTISDARTTKGGWPKVEKRIQEIRKTLREVFGLAEDPIPFIEGTGYRARFRIGCAQSYKF